MPGTKSDNSKPSASVFNCSDDTDVLIGNDDAVKPPSKPPAVLIASANNSVASAGLDGPALSSTILGGCWQLITLLAVNCTRAPYPTPIGRFSIALLSISLSEYFNATPRSNSAGNISYTPLSSILSSVILPDWLIFITSKCACWLLRSGLSSPTSVPFLRNAWALKPLPVPIALTSYVLDANSGWNPPFCIMLTLPILSLCAVSHSGFSLADI